MTNHPLRVWRRENGVSGGDFGACIGVSKFAVYDYELCRRFPRPKPLGKIEQATNGAVTAASMLAAYRAVHPDSSPDGEDTP